LGYDESGEQLIDYICTINEPNLTKMSLATAGGGPPKRLFRFMAQTLLPRLTPFACPGGDKTPPLVISDCGDVDTNDMMLRHGRMAAAMCQKFNCSPEALGGPFPFVALGAEDEFMAGFGEAHKQAVAAIRQVDRRGLIKLGLTISMGGFYPVPGGEAALADIHAESEDQVLSWAADCDFIGVQVYFATPVGPDGPQISAGGERTQMGYPFSPEGLEYAVRYVAQQTGLPVLITENGLATEDDTRRVEFIRRAVQHVRNCAGTGISVLGYCYSALFDAFEWSYGYYPKVGLVSVDRSTKKMERRVKPSAWVLGRLAATGGVAAGEEVLQEGGVSAA
jgi:beta-glucosidase